MEINPPVYSSFDYDRPDYIRQFCEGNDCQLFFYIGDSDWISFTKNPGDGATLQRYLYANGRPIRYDNLAHYQHPSYYFRYNARGDMAGYVQKDGSSSGWRTFGAWGDKNDAASNQGYYNWNAAWGYMQFPLSFNFNQHDEWDMGLYFAHGRWYNQDTGLWLSPDGNGRYVYSASGTCTSGTYGPDVTEWLMNEMKAHFEYGQQIALSKAAMMSRAQLMFGRRSVIPIFLGGVATETPFSDIVREFKIGIVPLPDLATAGEAVEALGILEYGAYGLAVDYSNLEYKSANPLCGQGNCNGTTVANGSFHQFVTLCGNCIDESDMASTTAPMEVQLGCAKRSR